MRTPATKDNLMKLIVDLLLFKLAWIACVVGAGRGHPWLGPIAVLGVLGWHMATASKPFTLLALTTVVAMLGFLIDSTFAVFGVLEYAAAVPADFLAPVWIVAMWVNFALILESGLGWLRRHPALGAGFGLIGGPLAYYAGAKLDAVAFATPAPVALGLLAAVWALSVPALLRYSAHIQMRPATASG